MAVLIFLLVRIDQKLIQGSHRLEKYLNIQDFLEKSLNINLPGKANALKSPWILPFTGGFNSVFGDLNQYKIVVSLFGAAYTILGTTIL